MGKETFMVFLVRVGLCFVWLGTFVVYGGWEDDLRAAKVPSSRLIECRKKIGNPNVSHAEAYRGFRRAVADLISFQGDKDDDAFQALNSDDPSSYEQFIRDINGDRELAVKGYIALARAWFSRFDFEKYHISSDDAGFQMVFKAVQRNIQMKKMVHYFKLFQGGFMDVTAQDFSQSPKDPIEIQHLLKRYNPENICLRDFKLFVGDIFKNISVHYIPDLVTNHQGSLTWQNVCGFFRQSFEETIVHMTGTKDFAIRGDDIGGGAYSALLVLDPFAADEHLKVKSMKRIEAFFYATTAEEKALHMARLRRIWWSHENARKPTPEEMPVTLDIKNFKFPEEAKAFFNEMMYVQLIGFHAAKSTQETASGAFISERENALSDALNRARDLWNRTRSVSLVPLVYVKPEDLSKFHDISDETERNNFLYSQTIKCVDRYIALCEEKDDILKERLSYEMRKEALYWWRLRSSEASYVDEKEGENRRRHWESEKVFDQWMTATSESRFISGSILWDREFQDPDSRFLQVQQLIREGYVGDARMHFVGSSAFPNNPKFFDAEWSVFQNVVSIAQSQENQRIDSALNVRDHMLEHARRLWVYTRPLPGYASGKLPKERRDELIVIYAQEPDQKVCDQIVCKDALRHLYNLWTYMTPYLDEALIPEGTKRAEEMAELMRFFCAASEKNELSEDVKEIAFHIKEMTSLAAGAFKCRFQDVYGLGDLLNSNLEGASERFVRSQHGWAQFDGFFSNVLKALSMYSGDLKGFLEGFQMEENSQEPLEYFRKEALGFWNAQDMFNLDNSHN